MRRNLATVLLALAVAAAGCSGNGRVVTGADGQVVRSPLERETSAADDEDVRLLTAGQSEFAVALYGALRGREGNLVFSPYGVQQALAMVYAGAAGETKRQMTEMLGFALLGDRVHPTLNMLASTLAERESEPGTGAGHEVTLGLASSIWAQRDSTFRGDYLDVLAAQYGSGVHVVDYQEAPEEARTAINAWTAEHTEGRLAEPVPAGGLDARTRLVVASAVTFQAPWQDAFHPSRTVEALFFSEEGRQTRVQMMRREGLLRYAQSADLRAVELPYAGGQVVMTIILPDPGRFEAFQGDLTAERLDGVLGSLTESTLVDLGLPKFSSASGYSLAGPLANIGIADAFQAGVANLSGIDGTRELFVDDVVHRAAIEIIEAGAGAATETTAAVGGGTPSLEGMPVTLLVDHPFIYLIRDRATGAILFMGRLAEPVG